MTDNASLMIHPTLKEALEAEGYIGLRAVTRNGQPCVIGLRRFIYTFGLVSGITETAWSERWCYEHLGDAAIAIVSWDGQADPPGPWVKHKGDGGEYLGPGATEKGSL